MEVFSYECSILDDNFPTIIKVDFSDNFPTAENLARQRGEQLSHLRWQCNGRVLDFRSRGRRFKSRSGCNQVVTSWMGDCLQIHVGKPSRNIG